MNPQNKTPISCEQALEMIEVYIDDELAREEVQSLETHIHICVQCSQELHFARRLYTELHSFPTEECPDRVVEDVLRRVQPPASLSGWEKIKSRLFSSPAFRPAFAGLALAAVVAGIMILTRQQEAAIQVTPAEIAKAKAQVQWTIAYLGAVTSQAGMAAREKVLKQGVAEPVGRVIGATTLSEQE